MSFLGFRLFEIIRWKPEESKLSYRERKVWNGLRQLKNTATGPDNIPFWVWKDQAEIFKSIICMIWNLSLKFSTSPSSWKRAHVTPLPEVDVPKERQTPEGSTLLRSLRAHLRSGCISSTRRTLLRNTWAWLSSPTGKGELYRCTPKCAVQRVLPSRQP